MGIMPSSSRQNDDALFEATSGAYAVGYRLPDDPPPAGPERKESGLRSAWGGTDTGWRVKATAAVQALAATGDTFTADDVRAEVDDDAISPAAWGALLSGCARKGWISKVGYVPSDRAERHGSVVAQWRGAA